MGQPPSDAAHGGTASSERIPTPRVVLVCADDVARSIGRKGFLDGRIGSGAEARIEVTAETAAPLAILRQRLDPAVMRPALEAPDRLRPWIDSMVTSRMDDESVSLIVLSVAPDFVGRVWRHNDSGLLVHPPDGYEESWTEPEIAWLEAEFTRQPLQTIETIEEGLRHVAADAAGRGTGLLVYNVSTVTPEEKIYTFAGRGGDTLAVRANRIDLLLDRLAAELDFSLVDVDRIVAELGAGEHMTASARYSDAACEAIAEEALTAIADLPEMSRHFGTDVMRLTVPRYDKRTIEGTIVAWHCTAPITVARGDLLFDVRYDNLHYRLEEPKRGRESHRSLLVSVLAAHDGHLHEILRPAGAKVEVGTTVGIVTKDDATTPALDESTVSFPVGVKVATR